MHGQYKLWKTNLGGGVATLVNSMIGRSNISYITYHFDFGSYVTYLWTYTTIDYIYTRYLIY